MEFRKPDKPCGPGLECDDNQRSQDASSVPALDLFMETLEQDAESKKVRQLVPPSPLHTPDSNFDIYSGLDETGALESDKLSKLCPLSGYKETARDSPQYFHRSQDCHFASPRVVRDPEGHFASMQLVQDPEGCDKDQQWDTASPRSPGSALHSPRHCLGRKGSDGEGRCRGKKNTWESDWSNVATVHIKSPQQKAAVSRSPEDEDEQASIEQNYQKLLNEFNTMKKNFMSLCLTANKEVAKKDAIIAKLRDCLQSAGLDEDGGLIEPVSARSSSRAEARPQEKRVRRMQTAEVGQEPHGPSPAGERGTQQTNVSVKTVQPAFCNTSAQTDAAVLVDGEMQTSSVSVNSSLTQTARTSLRSSHVQTVGSVLTSSALQSVPAVIDVAVQTDITQHGLESELAQTQAHNTSASPNGNTEMKCSSSEAQQDVTETLPCASISKLKKSKQKKRKRSSTSVDAVCDNKYARTSGFPGSSHSAQTSSTNESDSLKPCAADCHADPGLDKSSDNSLSVGQERNEFDDGCCIENKSDDFPLQNVAADLALSDNDTEDKDKLEKSVTKDSDIAYSLDCTNQENMSEFETGEDGNLSVEFVQGERRDGQWTEEETPALSATSTCGGLDVATGTQSQEADDKDQRVYGHLKDVHGEAWTRKLLLWPTYAHRIVSRRQEIDLVYNQLEKPRVWDWQNEGHSFVSSGLPEGSLHGVSVIEELRQDRYGMSICSDATLTGQCASTSVESLCLDSFPTDGNDRTCTKKKNVGKGQKRDENQCKKKKKSKKEKRKEKVGDEVIEEWKEREKAAGKCGHKDTGSLHIPPQQCQDTDDAFDKIESHKCAESVDKASHCVLETAVTTMKSLAGDSVSLSVASSAGPKTDHSNASATDDDSHFSFHTDVSDTEALSPRKLPQNNVHLQGIPILQPFVKLVAETLGSSSCESCENDEMRDFSGDQSSLEKCSGFDSKPAGAENSEIKQEPHNHTYSSSEVGTLSQTWNKELVPASEIKVGSPATYTELPVTPVKQQTAKILNPWHLDPTTPNKSFMLETSLSGLGSIWSPEKSVDNIGLQSISRHMYNNLMGFEDTMSRAEFGEVNKGKDLQYAVKDAASKTTVSEKITGDNQFLKVPELKEESVERGITFQDSQAASVMTEKRGKEDRQSHSVAVKPSACTDNHTPLFGYPSFAAIRRADKKLNFEYDRVPKHLAASTSSSASSVTASSSSSSTSTLSSAVEQPLPFQNVPSPPSAPAESVSLGFDIQGGSNVFETDTQSGPSGEVAVTCALQDEPHLRQFGRDVGNRGCSNEGRCVVRETSDQPKSDPTSFTLLCHALDSADCNATREKQVIIRNKPESDSNTLVGNTRSRPTSKQTGHSVPEIAGGIWEKASQECDMHDEVKQQVSKVAHVSEQSLEEGEIGSDNESQLTVDTDRSYSTNNLPRSYNGSRSAVDSDRSYSTNNLPRVLPSSADEDAQFSRLRSDKKHNNQGRCKFTSKQETHKRKDTKHVSKDSTHQPDEKVHGQKSTVIERGKRKDTSVRAAVSKRTKLSDSVHSGKQVTEKESQVQIRRQRNRENVEQVRRQLVAQQNIAGDARCPGSELKKFTIPKITKNVGQRKVKDSDIDCPKDKSRTSVHFTSHREDGCRRLPDPSLSITGNSPTPVTLVEPVASPTCTKISHQAFLHAEKQNDHTQSAHALSHTAAAIREKTSRALSFDSHDGDDANLETSECGEDKDTYSESSNPDSDVSHSDGEDCSDSVTDSDLEGCCRTRWFVYHRDPNKPRPELEMSIEDESDEDGGDESSSDESGETGDSDESEEEENSEGSEYECKESSPEDAHKEKGEEKNEDESHVDEELENESCVHKGESEDESCVHKGESEDESCVHKGGSEDDCVHKGESEDESCVHKGGSEDESCVHKRESEGDKNSKGGEKPDRKDTDSPHKDDRQQTDDSANFEECVQKDSANDLMGKKRRYDQSPHAICDDAEDGTEECPGESNSSDLSGDVVSFIEATAEGSEPGQKTMEWGKVAVCASFSEGEIVDSDEECVDSVETGSSLPRADSEKNVAGASSYSGVAQESRHGFIDCLSLDAPEDLSFFEQSDNGSIHCHNGDRVKSMESLDRCDSRAADCSKDPPFVPRKSMHTSVKGLRDTLCTENLQSAPVVNRLIKLSEMSEENTDRQKRRRNSDSRNRTCGELHMKDFQTNERQRKCEYRSSSASSSSCESLNSGHAGKCLRHSRHRCCNLRVEKNVRRSGGRHDKGGLSGSQDRAIKQPGHTHSHRKLRNSHSPCSCKENHGSSSRHGQTPERDRMSSPHCRASSPGLYDRHRQGHRRYHGRPKLCLQRDPKRRCDENTMSFDRRSAYQRDVDSHCKSRSGEREVRHNHRVRDRSHYSCAGRNSHRGARYCDKRHNENRRSRSGSQDRGVKHSDDRHNQNRRS